MTSARRGLAPMLRPPGAWWCSWMTLSPPPGMAAMVQGSPEAGAVVLAVCLTRVAKPAALPPSVPLGLVMPMAPVVGCLTAEWRLRGCCGRLCARP